MLIPKDVHKTVCVEDVSSFLLMLIVCKKVYPQSLKIVAPHFSQKQIVDKNGEKELSLCL